jgi:hypothetical protein
VGSRILGKRKLDEAFARYRSRRRANIQLRSELDAYLEENFVESSVGTFDILKWWKSNAENYPVLSAMARDFFLMYLLVPCRLSQHSVAVEDILKIHRAR